MTETQKMAILVIALLLATVLIVCLILTGHTDEVKEYTEYTVQQGDTLWSIAKQSNYYNGENARDIVKMICAETGCTTTIYAGQTVLIPQK